jgi:benzodiazapine receptor
LKHRLALILFLLLVIGGGLVIGWLTAPGEWYAQLHKAAFTPPNWLFGPVWTCLYVLIAVAGWRTWRRDPHGGAMRLWWLQLLLNFLWSPVFFVAHQISIALAIIAALLAATAAFIVASWPADRVSAALFVPYFFWVGFATALNASIVALNR